MLHLLDMPGIARLYNHHVSSTVMAAEQPLFSLQEISQFPGFFQSVSLTLHGSGWNSCQGVTISRRCNATAVAVVSHRAPSLQGTKGSAVTSLSSSHGFPAALPALPKPNCVVQLETTRTSPGGRDVFAGKQNLL